MSIGVPVILDPGIQADLNQSAQPTNQTANSDNNEFSSVIDNVSNTQSSNEFSESSYHSQENDRNTDQNAQQSEGNNLPDNGNEVPSENESEQAYADQETQSSESDATLDQASSDDGDTDNLVSETDLGDESPDNIDQLLALENEFDSERNLQERLAQALARSDGSAVATSDIETLDPAFDRGGPAQLVDLTIGLSDSGATDAPSTLISEATTSDTGLDGEILEPAHSQDLVSETIIASDIRIQREALGRQLSEQPLDEIDVIESNARRPQVPVTPAITNEGLRTQIAADEAIRDQPLATSFREFIQAGATERNVNADRFINDLATLATKEGLTPLSREVSPNSLASLATNVNPTQSPALGGASTLGSQSLLGNLSGTNLSGNPLLSLNTAVDQAAWPDEFAVRIRTLVSGNVQQATLNLNPSELGSIEVNLVSEGNETRAQFAVQNTAVREVIESSLPRLREIFEESGLSLADTDVRDQTQSENAGDDNNNRRTSSDANTLNPDRIDSESEAPTVSDSSLRWQANGLRGGVDTFI